MLKLCSFPEKINALRVALAACIGYLLTHSFKIAPYWVLITIVFVSQPNIGATLSRSKQRALSTIVGVVIGGFLVVVLQQIFWLNIVVGVICVFMGMIFLLKRYDVFVFFLTVIIILAFGYHASNVWQFVLFRFIDTIIGIGIIFILAFCFFPKSAVQFLRADYLASIAELKNLFVLITRQSYCQEDKTRMAMNDIRIKLYSLQVTSERHYADLTHETTEFSEKRACVYTIILQIERLRGDLFMINKLLVNHVDISKQFYTELRLLNENAQLMFDTLILALQGKSSGNVGGLEVSLKQLVLQENELNSQHASTLFLQQCFNNLTLDLMALHRCCQRFCELAPNGN